MCPRGAVLAMQRDVLRGDLVGSEQRIRSALAFQVRVALRANLAVDDYVRDVDVFRPELARHALRNCA